MYKNIKSVGSFGGVKEFAKHNNLTLKEAREELEKEESYTLFRPTRNKFERRQILGNYINNLHVLDLAEVGFHPFYPQFNNGVRFLMVIVDTLSRRCFIRGLKNKTSKETSMALDDIYQHPENRCDLLLTDEGGEFLGACKKIYEKYNINHYHTQQNEIKGSQSERKILDIKRMIVRYLYATNTHKYIDILPLIEQNLNSRENRIIKMSANDVNNDNESIVYSRSLHKKKENTKFKIGDNVRIVSSKYFGQKEHKGKWSMEIYIIYKIDKNGSVPCFYLKDKDHEKLVGKFYEKEIQKVQKPDLFEIEEILKEKTIRKKKFYLVKFRGYKTKPELIEEKNLKTL